MQFIIAEEETPFFIPHSTPEINSILNVQFSSIPQAHENETSRMKGSQKNYEGRRELLLCMKKKWFEE